ncbi:MAG: GAF domain-containing protein [Myxococcota bacterium]
MNTADGRDYRVQSLERRIESVVEIGRALASTLDLDPLLHLILDTVTELVDADRSTLFLLDEERGELWSKIAQGDLGVAPEIRVRLGEGVAGWVARSGKTLTLDDAYQDERFNPEFDRQSGYRTRSILCVPLADKRGRTIGVIQALNKRSGPFTADDVELLQSLAGQAAVALENARLYESVLAQKRELEERVHELDVLVETERDAGAAQGLDDMLDRMLQRAMDLVGAEAGSIALRDRASATLLFRSARGRAGEAVRRLRLADGEGIVGFVATRGESALVDDPAGDPRHSTDFAQRIGHPPRNIVCVPLFGEDGPVGAVELLDKTPAGQAFTAADVKLLTLIAGQISKALQLARAREERINESRLAAIGQLLASVLHDLRTPMTVISGYAQLMAASGDATLRAEHARQIDRQFELVGAMMREVLAFARGETQLLARKVYLHKFMEEVEAQMRAEFSGSAIEVAVEIGYRGVAWFDELKLLRAVHNIARNAREAMEGGGRFAVGLAVDGADLVFTFADSGPGIPPEIEGRLFDPFVTSGKQGGTGLGLAIVKKIVEDHGGRVACRSSPGSGTTFELRLPRERRNDPPA